MTAFVGIIITITFVWKCLSTFSTNFFTDQLKHTAVNKTIFGMPSGNTC